MTSTIAQAPRSPRNIQKTVTIDRERCDAVDQMSRGLGISWGSAICRLIDMHAGMALEAIEQAPTERYQVERAKQRRLTGELISDVAGEVREGSTKADAWRLVGVTEDTGRNWEKKGREDRKAGKPSLYADLVVTLEKARAEFNRDLIREAVRKGDYKSLLKAIDPEQFDRPSRSEVDITHRFQLVIDWDVLSIEETATLARLLKKGSPPADHPAVNRTNRPAREAIPTEVVELLDEHVDEGEWEEAPLLEDEDGAEAPVLEQKPEH